MTNILIVDDQRLFAESLKTVLEGTQADFTVCAIAENGAEAIAAVSEHKPSIILMDVRMPEMDGVAATRIIHGRSPEIPIIMLTTFEDDEYVREALSHGAKGYLLKNIPSSQLIASIRAVLSGAMLLDPRVLGALVAKGKAGAGQEPGEGQPSAKPQWFDLLSRKEKQILGLMVEGFHNDEIADKLFIAAQTVRNYISRIYDKTGAEDRVQAIRIARSSGEF